VAGEHRAVPAARLGITNRRHRELVQSARQCFRQADKGPGAEDPGSS
jgi:hypothetical protein